MLLDETGTGVVQGRSARQVRAEQPGLSYEMCTKPAMVQLAAVPPGMRGVATRAEQRFHLDPWGGRTHGRGRSTICRPWPAPSGRTWCYVCTTGAATACWCNGRCIRSVWCTRRATGTWSRPIAARHACTASIASRTPAHVTSRRGVPTASTCRGSGANGSAHTPTASRHLPPWCDSDRVRSATATHWGRWLRGWPLTRPRTPTAGCARRWSSTVPTSPWPRCSHWRRMSRWSGLPSCARVCARRRIRWRNATRGRQSTYADGRRPSSWPVDERGHESWTTMAVTMPNMPSSASTWLRMWQWKAHAPGSVASTSTSTRSPGATSTVSSICGSDSG
jgi:hypothetical protein